MRDETAMNNQMEAARQSPDAARVVRSPSALKAAICEEATWLCADEHGGHLSAIVLTGSLARDEATVVGEAPLWRFLSDADFLLVFRPSAALPPATHLERLGGLIKAALRRRGILCRVTLSAVHPGYLRKLQPHIFAFELRAWGQVVCGEPTILSLIPSFCASDIPLEDAWRLLSNRMVEQLEIVDELANGFQALPHRALYRTVKLYLDMATSFLLFVGAYEPTYQGRARKLEVLADKMPPAECPFPLRNFSEKVTAWTQWKLFPAEAPGSMGKESWEEATGFARLLWRWELARLTGSSLQIADGELWEKCLRQQPVSSRLRGWLYVLRRQGWHRSWREWPRWGWRGWQASPRYWVYSTACGLFFRLPHLLRPAGQQAELDADCDGLRAWLPAKRARAEGPQDWRRLASDIVWNYREFLEGTRA